MSMSHEGCGHASNKAARAKCRRLRVKFDSAFDAVMAEAAEPTITPATAVGTITGAQMDSYAAADPDDADDKPATDGDKWKRVTRENWQSYKGQRIEMQIKTDGVQGPSERVGTITGWGEKKIRYISDAGKLNMVDAERVIVARVAE